MKPRYSKELCRISSTSPGNDVLSNLGTECCRARFKSETHGEQEPVLNPAHARCRGTIPESAFFGSGYGDYISVGPQFLEVQKPSWPCSSRTHTVCRQYHDWTINPCEECLAQHGYFPTIRRREFGNISFNGWSARNLAMAKSQCLLLPISYVFTIILKQLSAKTIYIQRTTESQVTTTQPQSLTVWQTNLGKWQIHNL